MLLQLFPRNLWSVGFLFFIFLLFSPLGNLNAQAPNVAGIGIKPATIENAAEPGETQNHSVEITNLSSSDQTYYLYTRDIVAVKEGGVPVFAKDNEEKTGYELTEWLTLSTEEIELSAGESGVVDIQIDVPENATPGSHFGGMFVSMQPPRLRSTGASVGYEVANIISIRVAGDSVENAQIRSFSTDNFIHSRPVVDFNARVENKGTILVRPTGPLEIYNMFGKKVTTVIFNDSKAGIFPQSVREFDMRWEGDGPGFGRYQAVLSLVYGAEGRQSTISSTLSFWILPMNIILPAVGVLAFILLTVYISVRMYISRTMKGMSGGSRKLVRKRKSNGISALLLVAVVMLAVTALFLIVLLALFA